jgi:DNA-binding IscR family transcriptional regulator
MFSKACEYAIKSVIFIAQEALAGRKTNVNKFLKLQMLQKLSLQNSTTTFKKGILISNKGKQGGFTVDLDKIEHIKIIEIILATDGEEIFTRCAFGLEKCSSEKPCPFHFTYKPIREGLKNSLSEISIYDMALKTEQGEAFLKI